MKRFLCDELPTPNHPVRLDSREKNHARQVLRLKPDALVEVLDGKGHACIARIQYQDQELLLHHDAEASNLRQAPKDEIIPVTLEAAVLKGDAFEWLIEKATELGVKELTPIKTLRTVVKWNQEKEKKLLERWTKISNQSLKQCGRLNGMKINPPRRLSEVIQAPAPAPNEIRLFCNETLAPERSHHLMTWIYSALSKKPCPWSHFRILVGPEGGFDPSEIELITSSSSLPHQSVSLGPVVTRAETASLYAISLVSGFFRSDMSK